MHWAEGVVVVGIEVWATNVHVNGIKLRFADGKHEDFLFGRASYNGCAVDDRGRHDMMIWEPEERIEEMSLAATKYGKGDAVGAIFVRVGGKILDINPTKLPLERVDLGRGILLGASGFTCTDDNVISVAHDAMQRSWYPLFMGIAESKGEVVDFRSDQSLDDLNKKQK